MEIAPTYGFWILAVTSGFWTRGAVWGKAGGASQSKYLIYLYSFPNFQYKVDKLASRNLWISDRRCCFSEDIYGFWILVATSGFWTGGAVSVETGGASQWK